MKKLLKYVLLILIGVIAFLLTSFIVLTQVAPRLEHSECYSSGGKWATFPTGCADRCGAQVCTQAFTEGCDCGADKCWNGTHCSYERVEMKEKISLPSTEVPNATNNTEVEELYFETISKGSSSGHEERAAYAIINSSEWSSLVRKVRVKAPLPEIDFGKEMVVAVFQGTFGSGRGIEITKLIEKEDSLEVFVRENNEANAMNVETRPYHIIKTAKSWKKVIFPEGNFLAVKSEYHGTIRIMGVGETKTFTIDTKDYEATITKISGMPPKVGFILNGEAFELEKGEAYETKDRLEVKVHNLTDEFVEFELLP